MSITENDNRRLAIQLNNSKFIQTGEKIKNPSLSDDNAWKILHQVMEEIVPDFCANYGQYLGAFREMFDIRRLQFTKGIKKEEVVRRLVEYGEKSLDDEVADRVEPVSRLISTIFERSVAEKRRNKRR